MLGFFSCVCCCSFEVLLLFCLIFSGVLGVFCGGVPLTVTYQVSSARTKNLHFKFPPSERFPIRDYFRHKS